MDFPRIADLVAIELERAGQPLALVGAFALHAYGHVRASADLDFVTDRSGRDGLIARLEALGYETLHRSEGYSNHLHPDPALGRVDFIYVAGETSRKLFADAPRTLRLGSREIKVPRAEHLAAMKVQAMKNDPRRAPQDLADVAFLLRLGEIDREEVRGYFEKAGMGERFDELLRSL